MLEYCFQHSLQSLEIALYWSFDCQDIISSSGGSHVTMKLMSFKIIFDDVEGFKEDVFDFFEYLLLKKIVVENTISTQTLWINMKGGVVLKMIYEKNYYVYWIQFVQAKKSFLFLEAKSWEMMIFIIGKMLKNGFFTMLSSLEAILPTWCISVLQL